MFSADSSVVIGAKSFDPRLPTIFGKPKKSDRANFTTISCSCPSCPLRAARQCVMTGILAHSCPYGNRRVEIGPTGRASSLSSWIIERKEKTKGVGWPGFAPKKLAFIGDYVYLPYSHMDMSGDVAFLRKSAFLISGTPFIKRADWTIENVVKLLDFQPQAIFGGTITSYQADEVPKFIQHIRELDSDMWNQLVACRPHHDTQPNYIGRKAKLWTLNFPIVIPARDDRYPVVWEWDGDHLRTTSGHAYNCTWGGISAASHDIRIKPAADATVTVCDNGWVNLGTEFVD